MLVAGYSCAFEDLKCLYAMRGSLAKRVKVAAKSIMFRIDVDGQKPSMAVWPRMVFLLCIMEGLALTVAVG